MCTFRISNWFVTLVHFVLDWNGEMYFRQPNTKSILYSTSPVYSEYQIGLKLWFLCTRLEQENVVYTQPNIGQLSYRFQT